MTDARRYVVRLGKVRGQGMYIGTCVQGPCDRIIGCSYVLELKEAGNWNRVDSETLASLFRGRLVAVRQLPRGKARRVHTAKVLRTQAMHFRCEAVTWAAMPSKSATNRAETRGIARGYEKAAEDAERAAEKLWPRRVKL